MDLDYEGSSIVSEGFKRKSRPQLPERPKEEKHYILILDKDEEDYLDSNARIILLNQCTQKPLSVIITKEDFLSSIQKFTSP